MITNLVNVAYLSHATVIWHEEDDLRFQCSETKMKLQQGTSHKVALLRMTLGIRYPY